jgi:hypothetical protein
MLSRQAFRALIGALAPLVLVSPMCAQSQTDEVAVADPGKLVALATIIRSPGSMCDLPKPTGAFRTTFRSGVSTTTNGCMDMDTTRTVPVLLGVRNADSTKTVAFVLPALADVTVKTAKGVRPATAVYLRVGQNSGFVTEFSGIIELQIRPRETLWLLYLLPAPAAGSRLQVKGLASVGVKLE